MTGPGCSIELMKLDMGGSAAVFCVAKALGQIKPLGVEVLHFSQPHSCMRSRGFTHISLSINFLWFSLLTGSLSNVARHGRLGTGTPGDDLWHSAVVWGLHCWSRHDIWWQSTGWTQLILLVANLSNRGCKVTSLAHCFFIYCCFGDLSC